MASPNGEAISYTKHEFYTIIISMYMVSDCINKINGMEYASSIQTVILMLKELIKCLTLLIML
mgnify:CR=1 FL=1